MIEDCLAIPLTSPSPAPPSSCAPINDIIAQCTDANYTISSGSLLVFSSGVIEMFMAVFRIQGRQFRSPILLNINGSLTISGVTLEVQLLNASVAIFGNFIIQEGMLLIAFVISRLENRRFVFKEFSMFLCRHRGCPPLHLSPWAAPFSSTPSR